MLFRTSFAFLKHGSLWLYRLATWSVLVLGLGFVALVLILRYGILPNIDGYRPQIEQAISRAAGQPVSIGRMSGNWKGYQPELLLADVEIRDAAGKAALSLERIEAVISWHSLLVAELRFHSLEIHNPSIEVLRQPDGQIRVAGIAVGRRAEGEGSFVNWLLSQERVVVRDATVTWVDEQREADPLSVRNVSFRLENDRDLHRFGGSAEPPAELASAVSVRGEFAGEWASASGPSNGRLFVDLAYVNIEQIQEWVALPLEIERGLGALRLWLVFDGRKVDAATAEVKLVNVQTRLAPDLPWLELSRVDGRIGWSTRNGRSEFLAQGLGFATASGLELAPMWARLVRSDPGTGSVRSELSLQGLALKPVTLLSESLPISAPLRQTLARLDPSGMVDELKASWVEKAGAPATYSLQGRFTGIALRPDGPFPGVRGLSGRVEATERGGMLNVAARNGALEFPRVFSAGLPVDALAADAAWTIQNGQLRVNLRNASIANEHLAGNVAGTLTVSETAPAAIDLNGRLVRADVRQVWRYMPLVAPAVQTWLRRALVAGESRDVRLTLKGPLAQFPFPGDRGGVFEVVAKASGVTMDYAEGWPPVTGIAGEIVFRGARMDLRTQGASILGLAVADARASIADLGADDPKLVIEGATSGSSAEYLRFVKASPVSAHLDGMTDRMSASGTAALKIALELPLADVDGATVKGELVAKGNRVVVDPRVPPLEDFAARLEFTRHSLAVREGRARIRSVPFRFDAASAADGALVANLSGTLKAESLREVSGHRALTLLTGETPWKAVVETRGGRASARFSSPLTGITSSLPPPFAKAASAPLPVTAEFQERGGTQSLLSVTVDGIASAQLQLDGADPDGIKRGSVVLGEGAATLPPQDGLWIRGRMDAVDVDVWRSLAGPERGPGWDVAGVNLEIGTLDTARRRFHDIRIDAARKAFDWQGGGWDMKVSGRELAGEATWNQGEDARFQARFTRLSLPAPETTVQAQFPGTLEDERLPSMDVVADNFVFEGRPLGRLTLRAQHRPVEWQLQRLELDNPDARMEANGLWRLGAASRTDLNVRVEVNDIGRFFSRLGWADSVKGGKAMLEGPVAWNGSPTRVDVPSLRGKVRLEARSGRFRKIEPGVAKLLGVLSLQALPRRLTLDFRDVFSSGFTFDRIDANAVIQNGVASTEDFTMAGPAALVEMKGKVDLGAERQDLNVKVVPALSESVAVAGAIVNPAVGVISLLAQKALKNPIGQIAAFEYSLSGTWADPVVAKVNRPPPAQPARR